MEPTNSILSGKELFNIEEEPDNYLIEGLLWESDNIMILAKEKVGKSIFSVQMACALTSGEAFLGEYEVPEPMQVLYIQTESTQHETIQRLRAMTHENGVQWEPNNFHLLATHSLYLDDDDCLNWLSLEISKKNIMPRVIFIDPLYMSMKGSLIDDQHCRAMSRNMRKLGEMFKACIVLVHHEHRARRNKDGNNISEGDDSVMGSFVWKAFPSHIIRIILRSDGLRSMSCSTQRSSRVVKDMRLELCQPLPLCYRINGTADHPNYVVTVLNHVKQKGQKCANDIHAETGLSLSAVKKSLSYLSKHNVNRLIKVNPGKRPTYYEFNKQSTPLSWES